MEKVSPGQKLRIPAAVFNTMLDAAADFKKRSLNRQSEAIAGNGENGIVIVRNQTGADRPRFSVMGISGVIVTPSQNAEEFASRWALSCVAPTAAHLARFVVLQEPIKSGAMGRAMIIGVTPAAVKRLTGETSFVAGIRPGQPYLESGFPGAQILWEDSFTGENVHLALVRMPASFEPAILRMRVTSVQGDYIVCQRWTGSAFAAANENVAKPYLLRNSITSRNGITYTYSNPFTRTATQGASTETQVVVPSYYTSGDEIFAASVPFTGVLVAGTELKLLDINADGRAWAKQ